MGRKGTLPLPLLVLHQSLRSQIPSYHCHLPCCSLQSPQPGLASWACDLRSHTGPHAQSNAQLLPS